MNQDQEKALRRYKYMEEHPRKRVFMPEFVPQLRSRKPSFVTTFTRAMMEEMYALDSFYTTPINELPSIFFERTWHKKVCTCSAALPGVCLGKVERDYCRGSICYPCKTEKARLRKQKWRKALCARRKV